VADDVVQVVLIGRKSGNALIIDRKRSSNEHAKVRIADARRQTPHVLRACS
jgi:hypothetical protein